jgi:hypothetical protein
MKRLAPFALTAIAMLAIALEGVGCGGFTSIGDAAGAGGMGDAAGTGTGETGGDTATGGTGASMTGGTSGKGGTGAKGGTGGTGGGMTGGTGGGGTYEPCANKACGDTCTRCDPTDRSCVEDKAVKYCDVNGGCGLNFPICENAGCKSSSDCVTLDLCEICADGSAACPTSDCVMGQCVTSFPTCPATECMADSDCPVSKAPCQTCPDGTMACPWARCEAGKCAAGIDSCGNTDPCKGLACGDLCTTCNPDAGSGCVAIAMYCDENLQCQGNMPLCGGSQCMTDDDCATDVCGMCSDGTCASQICSSGKCTFSCPAPHMDLCGGCKSDEICVEQIGGPATTMKQEYHCDPFVPCPSQDPCLCVQDEGKCVQMTDGGGYCQCDNGIR